MSFNVAHEQLIQEFSRPVKENLSALITQLQAGLHHVREDDFSVYTGQTGEWLYSSLTESESLKNWEKVLQPQ